MSVVLDEMLNPFTASLMPLIETNPPRRGRPLRRPARVGTKMGFVDAYAALAGWMHRVCADLAGCYETSVLSMVRLGWCVA